MVRFVSENDFYSGFSEVYKLANFVLTISCNINSVEHLFSTLKRTKPYLRSARTQERLCDLTILSIERELLHKMKPGRRFTTALSKNLRRKRIDENFCSSKCFIRDNV